MGVVELDGDEVLSWFGGDVRDAAAAVFAVLEVDLRFGGSFHGDGETTSTGFTSPDHELVRQTHLT